MGPLQYRCAPAAIPLGAVFDAPVPEYSFDVNLYRSIY